MNDFGRLVGVGFFLILSSTSGKNAFRLILISIIRWNCCALRVKTIQWSYGECSTSAPNTHRSNRL